MKLADIQGRYDAIFSLGELCLTSIQLKRNGLRPFSGVLDWVASFTLKDVNRMLRNRFEGYLDRNNLKYLDTAGDLLYLVKELNYNILINHDFYTDLNDPEYLEDYPAIKAKYDRRMNRFLDYADSGKRLLFVRTGGTFEEVAELEQVLAGLVKGDFRVLFVHSGTATGIEDNEWPLERVCCVEMPPMAQLWENCHALWTELFTGIELVPQEETRLVP